MTVSDQISLVAVDWGTSNLRATLLDDTGAALDHRACDKGMSGLSQDGFEAVLVALLEDVLQDGKVLEVICCGMVGSRQGWREAPYVTAPCRPPEGAQAVRVAVKDPRLSVSILPGVKQTKPADVMRGEETQIAGFLTEYTEFDGVLCLPGTHTKWVRISAGEIVSFQTYMTGELYGLLSGQSVLRHSVEGASLDVDAFGEAVSDAMSRPQAFASKLFGIRAQSLIGDLSADRAKAQLSGYLLGIELAASRPYWLGMDIAVIGAPELGHLYQTALQAQGCMARLNDASGLTVKGLWAAYCDMKETA